MSGVGVRIENLTKRFGSVTAVDDLSLEIKPGELFTLLGPSGCGKTTLLRTIAGFYYQDAGAIYFNDRRIDGIPPYRRDTGMVFQSYAVFPFMNVYDNIAYGLKARRVNRDEIRRRVLDAIELVRLTGMEKRRPDQLSGGQQQRVAVARAVVIEPSVLLMDEPLSNLDAKLRVGMRVDIKRLQKKLGITMIYVTHDQEEALAISDRIAVMSKGKIVQIGSPWEIYHNPANAYVADFIGVTNFFRCPVERVGKEGTTIEFQGKRLTVPGILGRDVNEVMASIRPEAMQIISVEGESVGSDGITGISETSSDERDKSLFSFSAEVYDSTYLGSVLSIIAKVPDGTEIQISIANPRREGLIGEGKKIEIGFSPGDLIIFPVGEEINGMRLNKQQRAL